MPDDDYVLLLILREKWPVGNKAKFKLKAERVSAEFTYHFLVCPPQKGVTPDDDDDALQTAETQSLAAMLPVLKANRSFAASSGLRSFCSRLPSNVSRVTGLVPVYCDILPELLD